MVCSQVENDNLMIFPSRLLQISWCKDVRILHKDTVITQGSVDLAFTVVWL